MKSIEFGTKKEITMQEMQFTAPPRPRRVVRWVEHFTTCAICRNPETASAEAKTRSQLCPQGQKLLDSWLDED